ncbi:serine hydrolase domain-containing protein [Gaetbulibacter sp. M240]|uniref:serine hydrolase domain-containing protein n=1 Tax=Gaetbulibacter sp. M240 TaxID=3126511 RepID=UPI00374F076A
MYKIFRIILTHGCFIIIFFSSFLFSQNNSNNFEKAERIIKKILNKQKVPGLAITVSKNQNIVWSQGFGYSDLENKVPVDPKKTLFRVGSISKPITAVALMKTIEEGLISLDSSIYCYVPYFPIKKHDISIEQLGAHLSGIRNYKGNEFLSNESLSIKEGVSIFKNDSLIFKPGSDFAYTSYNWNLISLAIQEQAKMSFEDYVKTRVILPFKMKSTFADENEVLPYKAIFYGKAGRKNFKPQPEVNNYSKLGSGGYLSTSEDINRLGRVMLNDTLVNPEQLKSFITAQKTDDGISTYYGIGFEVSYDHKGRPYYGHVGNGLGGYGIFYVYPKQNIVLSILVNCSNPNIDRLFNKLIDAVFESLQSIPPYT